MKITTPRDADTGLHNAQSTVIDRSIATKQVTAALLCLALPCLAFVRVLGRLYDELLSTNICERLDKFRQNCFPRIPCMCGNANQANCMPIITSWKGYVIMIMHKVKSNCKHSAEHWKTIVRIPVCLGGF